MDNLERNSAIGWVKRPTYSAPIEGIRGSAQERTNSITISAEQIFFKHVKEGGLNFSEIVRLFQNDIDIPRSVHVHSFMLSKAKTIEDKEELLYLFPEETFSEVKKQRIRRGRKNKKKSPLEMQTQKEARDGSAKDVATRVVGDCTIILTNQGQIPEKIAGKNVDGRKIQSTDIKSPKKNGPVYGKKPDDISEDLWCRIKQGDFKGRLHGDRKPSKKLSGGRGFGKK